MEENNNRLNLSKRLFQFYSLLLSLYFLLNCIGTPLLKFLYPVLLLTASILILSEKSLTKSLFPVTTMILITGQGKILWSYNPVFHIAFDYLQLLFIFKVFYRQKSILNLNLIPIYLIIPIVLHGLWYLVQLFNFNNIGFIGTLAAGRVYILPLIFFLSVLNTPFEKELKDLDVLSKGLVLCFLAISLIAFIQYSQREFFLLEMSSYYKVIMGIAFIDDFFRPFGTTELPGGYTIYFAVLVGLIFLRPLSKTYQLLFLTFALPLTITASILSQVRSAYVKYFIIIAVLLLVIPLFQKITPLRFIKKIIPVSAVMGLVFLFLSNFLTDLNIENSLDRLGSILDMQVVSTTRSGPDIIFKTIADRLIETPIGLGPGRTGAAAGFSRHAIAQDPQYGLSSSWAYDNLLVSLAIDLGWGMLFFLSIVIGVCLKLINLSLHFYFKNKKHELRLVIIPALTCTVLVLGNWGAIGLTYNPEAFAFWLLAGIGLRIGMVHAHS